MNLGTSHIFAAMKRILIVLALIVMTAPAFAQSTEFSIITGASRRFVDGAPHESEDAFIESNLSLENNFVDLSWGLNVDPDTWIKFKAGRIETPVAFAYRPEGSDEDNRIDAEGEVQHIEMNAEYRFSEPFGSSGIFAGLGLYRQSAEGFDADVNYGFNAGVNADFPLSRRYGVVVEATYHWVRTDFSPRFLTVGAGLRVGF